jgi:protein SCO1/2
MTLRVLMAALVLACVAPGVSADDKLPIIRDVGFDQRLGQPLPLDATFRDETGRTVRLGDYFGKRPVVLSLAYYECPMLCTLTLNGMASALDILKFDPGKDFEIVTVSFEPREQPELAAAKKRTYLNRYKRPGAAEAWHFLTGDPDSIKRVTQAVGFRYAWDPATRQYAHPTGIVVATPDGHISRYLYGVEYAPKDLRLALVESSQGRIGSPVDQLLLLCYHYDPINGKYGSVVIGTLRISGVLTVLALGGFVFTMLKRERAAAARAQTARVS